MNTKQQGDIGVAAAVFHYTKLGYVVSQPLTDNSKYDLIVDDGISLLRVQCKTTGYSRNESQTYEVQLATSGGNQSWNKKARPIELPQCDIVFIYCMNGVQYEFPVGSVAGKKMLRLGSKQDQFKITN